MPEVTVTKNSNLPGDKGYIGFSKNRFIIPCESSNTMAVQLLTKQLFKCCIAIAHPAHIILYLFFTLFSSHSASPLIK